MNTTQALLDFAHGRPGIEPGIYSTWRDYRAEAASVTADLRDVRTLARHCELFNIPVPVQAGGRISITPEGRVDYCPGQYYPTEYRKAVARVLANAIWDYWRDSCGMAGDAMRTLARKQFGRRIGQRYFN